MLAKITPPFLVRLFAKPYVAGDSLEAALRVAEAKLNRFGTLTTLDLLGEGDLTPFQVIENIGTCERIVDVLGSDHRFADPATRPTLSIKPSAFTGSDTQACWPRIEALAARAKERGVALTIDMEDHPWTESTITNAVSLFERGHDVGTVLQTRMHRTEADLERMPAGMRVRLVIGIYPEVETYAIQSKAEMKERMLTYGKRLLERGARLEFATHDEKLLARFLRTVAPAAPERCEIQMLLGVPRRTFIKRLKKGHFGITLPYRRYVPFARGWDDATAYLRRRMAESPSLPWLVLRNVLRVGR